MDIEQILASVTIPSITTTTTILAEWHRNRSVSEAPNGTQTTYSQWHMMYNMAYHWNRLGGGILIGLGLFTNAIFVLKLLIHKCRYRLRFLLSRENNFKYYVSITAANTCFMLLHIYDLMEFSRVSAKSPSAQALCKLAPYAKHVARCFSFMLIVTYSLERAFSLAFPLETTCINKRTLIRFIFAFDIVAALVLPLHIIFQYDVVKRPHMYLCDVANDNYYRYNTLMLFYMLIVVILPFVAIISTNLSSIINVNRTKTLRRDSTSQTQSLSVNRKHSTQNGGQELLYKKVPTSSSSSPTRFTATRSLKTRHEVRFTNTLIALTLTYAFLNLPLFVIWSVYAIRRSNSSDRASDDDIFRLYTYIKLAEILHLSNYCLTGLLFLKCHSRWVNERRAKERKITAKTLELKQRRKEESIKYKSTSHSYEAEYC